MLKIKIIATGSAGNAYVIDDGGSKILIDPGIGIMQLKKALNFGLSSIEFCLLSHEHQDHAKSIIDVLKLGIPCAMSLGTWDMLDQTGVLALPVLLKSEVMWHYGAWGVLPFKTQHDAAEPLGFLLQTPSGKKVMFATDTAYVSYRFAGVTHYILECNYSEKLLLENDKLLGAVKKRIRRSHFELENVKEFFRRQDLTKTEKIYLIHLSESNADAGLFVDGIEKVTGKPVYLC